MAARAPEGLESYSNTRSVYSLPTPYFLDDYSFILILEHFLLSSVLQFCNAAAAKSLQSCLTLCDPIDGSLPGSPVPGIFQARTLEWVAISFSNAWKWKVKVKLLSHVRLLATPWTAAFQAPPSMGFARQEHWSGVPLPSGVLKLWNIFLNNNCSLGIRIFVFFLRKLKSCGVSLACAWVLGAGLNTCYNLITRQQVTDSNCRKHEVTQVHKSVCIKFLQRPWYLLYLMEWWTLKHEMEFYFSVVWEAVT